MIPRSVKAVAERLSAEGDMSRPGGIASLLAAAAITGPLLANMESAFAECAGFDQAAQPPADLTELSLTELMDVEITSVSKKPQVLREVPAAVYVITQEDIRRSGATTVADALRMAPGVEVARVNSHTWAVTTRGFNGIFADNLLVLLDGRNVYSPIFGGVSWEDQDTLLEDIDRIEVIRGPGGTTWGTNAVNGVINIITKCARDTQGTFVTAGGGDVLEVFSAGRHGFKIGEAGHARVYVKGFQRDEFESVPELDDAWNQIRTGFRGEIDLSRTDAVEFQGDLYSGANNEFNEITGATDTVDVAGGNVMARWARRFSERSDLKLQAYYDYAERVRDPVKTLNSSSFLHTFDVDFQHRFGLGDHHEISWGLGYRHYSDRIDDAPNRSFEPPEDEYDIWSASIQEQFDVVPDRWRFFVGSKFEVNEFSDFEYQPSARLLWTPDDQLALWGAVTRSVNVPSRVDQAFRATVPAPPGANPFAPTPLEFEIAGNPQSTSEKSISYEFGARGELIPTLTWDLALFYADYQDLLEFVPGALNFDSTRGVFVQIVDLVNVASATTHGVELALAWRLTDGWRMKAAYTYLDIDVDADSPDASREVEGRSPRHRLSLRSMWDIRHDLDLDLWLRYVDSTFSNAIGTIDAYLTMDARIVWRPNKSVELSFVAQDFPDNEHLEFGPQLLGRVVNEVPRSFYGQIRLWF